MERRTFLLWGSAGLTTLVAGCAGSATDPGGTIPSTGAPTGAPPEPTTPAPTTPAPTTPAPTSTDRGAEETSATQPTLPSRSDLVSRYAGASPVAFGLAVPGIVQGHSGRGVALTFDLCGGPHGEGFDHGLLEVLRSHEVASTFFLNSRWVRANPDHARDLAADPLVEIANHGHEHLPLSVTGAAAYGIPGTADVAEAYDEVAGALPALTQLAGRRPQWFRSGTAHCDDVGVQIAQDLGQVVVNFTVNGDAGATLSGEQVADSVAAADHGDIVIAHANQPASGTAEGVARALPTLLAARMPFVQLGQVLRPASPRP